jgi:hypothetical protein
MKTFLAVIALALSAADADASCAGRPVRKAVVAAARVHPTVAVVHAVRQAAVYVRSRLHRSGCAGAAVVAVAPTSALPLVESAEFASRRADDVDLGMRVLGRHFGGRAASDLRKIRNNPAAFAEFQKRVDDLHRSQGHGAIGGGGIITLLDWFIKNAPQILAIIADIIKMFGL